MRKANLICTAAAGVLLALGPAINDALARDTLTDAEMADERGGVLIAGQVAFEFGAVVKSYEDGALSLETQVTWTPGGPQIQQLPGAGVTPISDAVLKGLSGTGEAFQTPAGATIVQNVSQGQIVNVLLNTTSGHDFRQDTAVTLVLPGFAATQGAIAQQLLGLRLGEDVRSAAFFGIR